MTTFQNTTLVRREHPMTKRISVILIVFLLTSSIHAADRPDLLIADFEGTDYGAWKVEGTAFGAGPARGTLPNQMPVRGFLGKGLVNSYVGGDGSTGVLTSPAFKIERPFINFLIGGGGYKDEICMNLLVDGKVVRTATGPNTQPGGSEALDWSRWDVGELAGKEATIQIVDRRTGGWGHINVDHIVQSDHSKGITAQARELAIAKRYLLLPVAPGGPLRRMRCTVDQKLVDEFEIALAERDPAFWAFLDLSAHPGKTLRIEGRLPENSPGLAAITQDDQLKGEPLYQEKQRPQFHFTSRRGWLNDPNGLVFHQGEYHLFYQLNPYGWSWGNMHWGHAVSKDLVHWQELPIALYPRTFGDWCFSGSALVDKANTSGFQSGPEPPLVLAYTSTGRGECVAYSNDRGRTWKEFDGNPVIKHQGRDPKLLWHAPSKQWVLAVYDEAEGKQWIVFHTSSDLKTWKRQGRIEGYYECPDLFELKTNSGESRWVLYAADGKYSLGAFDGQQFIPDGPKHQLWHGNFYAAQTFSDTPDQRRIQIGWGQGIAFHGAAFNQQMTVPVELTLRKTDDGLRMFAEPVAELAALRGKKHELTNRTLKSGEPARLTVGSELLDVGVAFAPGQAESVTFDLHGVSVTYDARRQLLICKQHQAALKPVDGTIRLRVLVDRGSVEVFANGGRVAMSVGAVPDAAKREVALNVKGGEVRIESLVVHELRSAWR